MRSRSGGTGGGTMDSHSDSHSDGDPFVPSEAWRGSRPGYYFGTGPDGTGYYRDAAAGSAAPTTAEDKAAEEADADDGNAKPAAAKRARRTVLFDDDRNTTLEYEAGPAVADGAAALALASSNSAEATRRLEEAERNASQRVVVDLTPRGAKIAVRNLAKAHERNAVMRAEHETDPRMYMDSEVSLYEHLQALKGLAADPKTLYPVVLGGGDKDGGVNGRGYESGGDGAWETVCELLGHANPDVGAAVVSLLVEWLDPSLLLAAAEDQDQDRGDGEGEGDERGNNKNSAAVVVVELARCAVQDAVEAIVTQQLIRGAADLGGDDDNNDDGDGDGGGDDEQEDEVGKGVDDVLSLLENLLEIDQFAQAQAQESASSEPDSPRGLMRDGSSLAARLCRLGVLHWLFRQIQNQTRYHDRALELLVLVAAQQDVYAYSVVPDWSQIPSTPSTSVTAPLPHDQQQPVRIPDELAADEPSTLDGIEILLQTTAKFRKRQPDDEAELSVLENSCMVMGAALLFSPRNLSAFVERQGIELALRCLQERVHAGGLALKWLDVGTAPPLQTETEASSKANGPSGAQDDETRRRGDEVRRAFCEHMVKAGAFKYLFPMFMGRHAPKAAPVALAASKRAKREWSADLEATVLSVLYCLTVHLADDSPLDAKERLVAKFVEEEKCDRLVELCLRYDQKARQAEFNFYRDVEETLDPALAPVAALAAKLEGGGDALHRVCAVAAFCCVESRRCHERILSQLKLQQSGVTLIRDALQEFAANLEDGTAPKAQLEIYLEKL